MDEFPQNICIVDDDEEFARFLAEYLTLRGCRCVTYPSAERLMQANDMERYDFFILDLGLPGIDGVDLTSMIRGRNAAGILIVSGRLGPDAFNSALAAGADMFVNKPVRFDQVYHATQSIWRRFANPRVRSSQWTLSDDGAILTSPGGNQVSLTAVEGRLLQALFDSGARPAARGDLAMAAGIAQSADHRNLDAAVFRLRRKIERETKAPSPFKTVHGIGYQITDQALPVSAPGIGND